MGQVFSSIDSPIPLSLFITPYYITSSMVLLLLYYNELNEIVDLGIELICHFTGLCVDKLKNHIEILKEYGQRIWKLIIEKASKLYKQFVQMVESIINAIISKSNLFKKKGTLVIEISIFRITEEGREEIVSTNVIRNEYGFLISEHNNN